MTPNLRGTLIIAIPTKEGLVVCADKRLHNHFTGKDDDTFIKIHKLTNNALFVAVNDIGLLDKQTLKKELDAFDVVTNYSAKVSFADSDTYWSGLKGELKTAVSRYLSKRFFADWPESGDKENNDAMFSLIFYYLDSQNQINSRTLNFRYIKQQPPVIDPVVQPLSIVRNPKMSGKARAVIEMISNEPLLYQDPQISRLDMTGFNPETFSVEQAIESSKKLITVSNKRLPQAYISPSCDCAILHYKAGFKWL